jgi:hypothetical protein
VRKGLGSKEKKDADNLVFVAGAKRRKDGRQD